MKHKFAIFTAALILASCGQSPKSSQQTPDPQQPTRPQQSTCARRSTRTQQSTCARRSTQAQQPTCVQQTPDPQQPTRPQQSTCARRSTRTQQPTQPVNHADYQSSNIEAMQKTYDFIKQNCHSTYYLATVENDQPRVRPFGTVNIFEGKLYIQTGHKKDVAKQIAANPKVELCCFDGQANWLRLSGTLVEDERIEAKKAMLDAYPELRRMYDENDDNTAVFYFKDATARFDSFVNPQEIEKF